MVGTKNNPGKFDCYANAHPDEPMFILLGRDPGAPVLVDSWAASREHLGENQDKIAEARRCAQAMRDWLRMLGKPESKPVDCGPGLLGVGIDDARRQIVIELPRDLTGYIGFSAAEARNLAHVLLNQANDLEGA